MTAEAGRVRMGCSAGRRDVAGGEAEGDSAALRRLAKDMSARSATAHTAATSDSLRPSHR